VRVARPPSRDLFGLLLLDKPAGLSSNQALQRVRRLYQADKAGHGGSLDPLATGMLPIFFGAATRLAGHLLDARKVYRVTAKLGVATSTGDAEGEVTVDRSGEEPPTRSAVDLALEGFRGEIEQVPPMYSALKRGGVPLYRLARAGREVERAPRRVVIEGIELESYQWPALTLRLRCSKGTYVRTLVEDLAKAVGSVGHVATLRRLGVEPFLDREMHSWPVLEAVSRQGLAALDERLLRPDTAVPSWPAVTLDEDAAHRLCRGQAVATSPSVGPGAVRIYDPTGRFIAIGTVAAPGRLSPDRVFAR
jgi:tRNA pseudouridine55 synthase